MEDRNGGVAEKADEMILPGFRFHPTDEELVGFYLRRKVQQKPLSIELIRQLDIYKYDPWDLPKMATTGEKEWYFYCPRDRKYRNSARPNRVTGAGFWKATGTDRPIYSSDGAKCIGLKKSLVFYRGRAAKGVKTDWMMHEFRLPSIGPDKIVHPNDCWAICRIFKKTSSTARRAPPNSWVSTSHGAQPAEFFSLSRGLHFPQTNDAGQSAPPSRQLHSLLDFTTSSFYRPVAAVQNSTGFMVSPAEDAVPARIDFGPQQRYLQPPPMVAPSMEMATDMNGNMGSGHWGTLQTVAFPFSISSHIPDLLKSNQSWEA